MKTIEVSDRCAERIESLRRNQLEDYHAELENCLDVLTVLNNMLSFARESPEMGFYVDGIQKAEDKILDYYDFLKLISYEYDVKDFGRLKAEQPED